MSYSTTLDYKHIVVFTLYFYMSECSESITNIEDPDSIHSDLLFVAEDSNQVTCG